MTPDDSLERLRRELALRRLSHWWAKAEILLGLFSVAAGLFWLLSLAVEVIQQTRGHLPEAFGLPVGPAFGPVVLFVLGGYLALAGHRSHLYQSNNRIAAYLADLVREQAPPGPSEHETRL